MKNLNNCSVLHKIIFINGINIKKKKLLKKRVVFLKNVPYIVLILKQLLLIGGFKLDISKKTRRKCCRF
jgi:hypothetical protein